MTSFFFSISGGVRGKELMHNPYSEVKNDVTDVTYPTSPSSYKELGNDVTDVTAFPGLRFSIASARLECVTRFQALGL